MPSWVCAPQSAEQALWASHRDDGQTQAVRRENGLGVTHCVQRVRVQEAPGSTPLCWPVRSGCCMTTTFSPGRWGTQPGATEQMEELTDGRRMASRASGCGSLESWTWAQSNHELSPAKEPRCLVTGFSKGTKYAYTRLPLPAHISVNFPLMHL